VAKIDKSRYTKSQWRQIREQRRREKESRQIAQMTANPKRQLESDCAFVLGNGVSRRGIDLRELRKYGVIYGCNALYREFEPDYLVAVDVKMVNEICKSRYQLTNEVWTNPNRSYKKLHGLNYFHPSKGWSSGPTALWLASQHGYKKIYILGFDYKGVKDGQKFNNIYADSMNYKRSSDAATYFGNWLRQTKTVIQENENINYYRIITAENYCPEELNRLANLKTVFREDFEKIFNLK
jgi:hypothetical protein